MQGIRPIVTIGAVYALTLTALSVPSGMAQEADVFAHSGEIDSVTVYRGQALITRRITLPDRVGVQELLITDLPRRVVAGSLHAEGAPGVTVRSVRYRERPVKQDVSEEMEQLQQQLDAQRDQLTRIEREMELIEEHRAYLQQLENFTAGTARSDLKHGVLNAKTLRELSEYITAERKSLSQNSLALHFEQRDVKKEIEHTTREMNALGTGATHTAREAILIVDRAEGADGELQLHYLVSHASWEPSYTVRSQIDSAELDLEYFASIRQTSGEDWGDVHMTLSTATPSLVSRAPSLTALPVSLRPGAPSGIPGGHAGLPALRMQQLATDRARNVAAPTTPGQFNQEVAKFDSQLNSLADQLQLVELTSDAARQNDATSPNNEGHSVTYRIAGTTTLPSRPAQQLIRIAQVPMAGDFYQIAIPVLTSYVYEEAHVTNTSDLVLLGGPVSTYVRGEFVGQSEFDDIAIGEAVTVGLGINSNLRSERELINREERVQGGNRVVELTYRLSIQNFSENATIVRVLDRLPKVDPKEIQLTVVDDGVKSDAGIVNHERRDAEGILRWDLEVPGRAIAKDAAVIEYTIRIEHDRQMTLSSSQS
ncbi:MAG: mucoidy inhibitor MuiA family protein [Phycisphaerales bacterium]|nr:MAG: mucoidy inhibitor MuiA family protein [Phycisphaerales bacterium]